jgi:multicomponent K+:H+ antiporter subunit D
MTHLAVLPVLIPACAGVLMLLAGADRIRTHRLIALVAALAQLAVAALLVRGAAGGEITVYALGEWPAPFGIVLVIDRLAALMLLLTALVALPVIRYASNGWDTHGKHFHALLQFQLMGLSGAFATGDLFNLFVFFEILLIASYTLLLHGLGAERLKAGIHYVVLNLAASALFLVGVSLIYNATGTLNMADIALRVAGLGAHEAALAKSGAMILLVVFGMKAAIVPLHLWLPATYAAATAPVAALFAIMTKVGVYAIVRVHGTMFGAEAGHAALVAEPWLLPAALVTALAGMLGALAAHSLSRMIAWLTVSSVGTILAGVGLFSSEGLAASLYYLVHSTLIVAALFLLAEVVAAQRGAGADRLQPAPPVAQPALLGLLLLLGAVSVTGAPPLSGFIGKLMILESARQSASAAWIWGVLLVTSLLGVIGMARAGSILFWQVQPDAQPSVAPGMSWKLYAPPLFLFGVGITMVVFASPVKRYADAAAAQLADRGAYAAIVLGSPRGLDRSARPLGEARP